MAHNIKKKGKNNLLLSASTPIITKLYTAGKICYSTINLFNTVLIVRVSDLWTVNCHLST